MNISPRLSPSSVLLLACTLAACSNEPLPDIQIMDTGVFPESITSTADGAVISGSTKGVVYRAEPGAAAAHPWITFNDENGILSILGVLADDKGHTLWMCSAPNFFGPE